MEALNHKNMQFSDVLAEINCELLETLFAARSKRVSLLINLLEYSILMFLISCRLFCLSNFKFQYDVTFLEHPRDLGVCSILVLIP